MDIDHSLQSIIPTRACHGTDSIFVSQLVTCKSASASQNEVGYNKITKELLDTTNLEKTVCSVVILL